MERLAASLDKTADAARYHAAADKLRGLFQDLLQSGHRRAGGLEKRRRPTPRLLFPLDQRHRHPLRACPQGPGQCHHGSPVGQDEGRGLQPLRPWPAGKSDPSPQKRLRGLTAPLGAGQKEDGSDGFQIYQNGGASACFAYFTLAALYDLGRRDEADHILFPMLDGLEKGKFQGYGPNGMTNDWKAWDGTPWGYEGLLVDNTMSCWRSWRGRARWRTAFSAELVGDFWLGQLAKCVI